MNNLFACYYMQSLTYHYNNSCLFYRALMLVLLATFSACVIMSMKFESKAEEPLTYFSFLFFWHSSPAQLIWTVLLQENASFDVMLDSLNLFVNDIMWQLLTLPVMCDSWVMKTASCPVNCGRHCSRSWRRGKIFWAMWMETDVEVCITDISCAK